MLSYLKRIYCRYSKNNKVTPESCCSANYFYGYCKHNKQKILYNIHAT